MSEHRIEEILPSPGFAVEPTSALASQLRFTASLISPFFFSLQLDVGHQQCYSSLS